MKGTPFYTGEYGIRQGHVEDRVNVWPLLYYREPALSIAWPFIEKTDEHIALRPVFSVYGLDDAERVYNVLWPLGQFDFQHDRHRIFPAFWGEDYACLFPLYWHMGHPLGAGGGVFLFASVLERFLGLYTSLNSFTKSVVTTKQREEPLRRWPPRAGEQVLL